MKTLFLLVLMGQPSEAPKLDKQIDLEKADRIISLSIAGKHKLNGFLSQIDLSMRERDLTSLRNATIDADRHLSFLCDLQTDAFFAAEFIRVEVQKKERSGLLNRKDKLKYQAKIRELRNFAGFSFKEAARKILKAAEALDRGTRSMNTASLGSKPQALSLFLERNWSYFRLYFNNL